MPRELATLVYTAFVLCLFIWERRRRSGTSAALLIPAIYFFFIASRPLSLWLGFGNQDTSGLQEGSPVDAGLYAALYVLAVLVLLRRSHRVAELVSRSWPALLFLLYCLISITWSDFPTVALKRWTKAVGDLAVVLVVLSDPAPVEALRKLLAWTAFLLLPYSELLLKYYPELGRAYDHWSGAPFVYGVSYNKNGLGAICLYWGLGYVWMLSDAWSEKPRKAGLVAFEAFMLLLAVWLLWQSNSATSTSCFLMGTGLILMARMRIMSRTPALLHCVVATMLLVVYAGVFLTSDTVSLLQRDSTLTGRTDLWQAIFEIQTNPIVGTGYESFWLGWRIEELWNQFWWLPTQAHNGYIEIYINLGAAGLCLLAVLILTGYGRVIRGVRRRETWSGLLLAYIVISIPYNFTEATFRLQNVPWVMLLLAVTGFPPRRAPRQPMKSRSETPVTVAVGGRE